MMQLVPTQSLVTPRRFDLAIKYRFFRHLETGDDPDSERIYRWHIEARKSANAKIGLGMDSKQDTDRYVRDCRALLISMANRGFDPAHAIPIDPDGELLGGAHRVACALALGIKEVAIERKEQYIWAPEWNQETLVMHGIDAADLERVRSDWLTIAEVSSQYEWIKQRALAHAS